MLQFTHADTEKAGPEQGGSEEKQVKEEGEWIDSWLLTTNMDKKIQEKRNQNQTLTLFFVFLPIMPMQFQFGII